MQPALRSPIPEASLAVFPVNGENSHQGLPSENPAPNQGHEVCNFTVLLGLQSTAVLNRVRPRSTGKELDTESENDYFGARYYVSSITLVLASFLPVDLPLSYLPLRGFPIPQIERLPYQDATQRPLNGDRVPAMPVLAPLCGELAILPVASKYREHVRSMA